ncbi:RagB/SusD family nutrient uptake outer membrane protein [Membranihabitans maritimus]|uniref:RagB/SusD family nutrient uptake outer membrane protein n=1 Tax=Membranihabitans maritimus TaxID=2904244 RepID=UPI001F2F2DC4|nr:RagB/SusD family nutrient uptake outer membrane protein [Membranihabitans maritimus]
MKFFNQQFILKNQVYLIILIAFFAFSCDEKEFLETEPIDFYTPINSYITADNYEAALMRLHTLVRNQFYSGDLQNQFPSAGMQGTDIMYLHKNLGFNSDISTFLLPTNELIYNALWRPAYQVIFDANVIIERAATNANELTEAEKVGFIAEAKFFRGYMYKMLANLYGGVPIVLEETKAPKRDYTRASREEVYQQVVLDLTEAAKNLGDVDDVADHRINRLAAYHLLSEVYISLEQWQESIEAASMVIDHPSTALMTERFGTRANEKFLIPEYDTDVYWDLFRQGNQNRSTGNTEAIWVLQYEWEIPGGGSGGPELERIFAPRAWQAKIENNDGSTSPLVPQPNAFTSGRSSGFIRPTYFFFETLWKRSGYDQDLRNSSANIVRDFIIRNPASDHFGKWIFKDNSPIRMESLNDTTRNMYPWMTKSSTPGRQPDAAYLPDQTVEGALDFSHRAFRDVYAIRLAETYLLRAEAYLGSGDLSNAAEDINIIRRRSHAPEITSSEIDIDYILDERARELYLEEFRLLTLTRLGKLIERTRQYNPHNGDTYKDHNELWPIPFSEIEKNLEGELVQNPGY